MTTTSSPIATIEQFKAALLRVRDSKQSFTDAQLKMLRAQCRAPDCTMTATQLADVGDFKGYSGANLQYGLFAAKVAHELGFTPELRRDGTPMWWSTLSYSVATSGNDETEQFKFTMRPELVSALKEMRWG